MPPWPVAACTDGSVSCGTVLWRFQGRLALTVVVKASFSLVRDGIATPAHPGEILAEDRPFDGLPSRSVQTASDLAPSLARCDVTFVGHAHPSGGRAAPAAAVRLGVFRGARPLLDKVVHVFGDRKAGAPEPFTRMPLVYERALGGPGQPNPVGVEAPNLVDPGDPRKPAGFGPISRLWPSRRRLLGKIDRRSLERPIAELPDAMPWDYFQAAPPDQQIEHLRGGEWLVLDGLHPSWPRVQTQLPPVRGAARVLSHGPGTPPAEHAVELVCDTLAIDGDRQLVSLVWRGHHEIAGGEPSLPSLRVAAALELPGAPIEWTRFSAGALHSANVPSHGEQSANVGGSRDTTAALRAEQEARLAQQPVAPFALAPAGASSTPQHHDATPWGASPLLPPPMAAAGEATVAHAEIPARGGEGTLALRSEQQASFGELPAVPFSTHHPSEAKSAPAAIPGAPWSGVHAAAPPRPAPGATTFALGGAESPPMHPVPPPALALPIEASSPPALTAASALPRTTRPAVAPAPAAPAPPATQVQNAGPNAARSGSPGLSDRLRAAGASAEDVAALMRALSPPPPPPPDEDA
jgi:hypothetical protein